MDSAANGKTLSWWVLQQVPLPHVEDATTIYNDNSGSIHYLRDSISILEPACPPLWQSAPAREQVPTGPVCRLLFTALLYTLHPCPGYAATTATDRDIPHALSDHTLPLQEVRPGVWVHQGQHYPITHPRGDDIANIGFIVGKHCIAVIDTGGSLAMGKALLQALRRVSEQAVCYVINTHIHFDHLLGNAAFAQGNTRFVGHTKLVESVEHNRAFFHNQFPSRLCSNSGGRVIAPDLMVAKRMHLDLGDRILTLSPFPAAHTNSDLTVFDEKTRTLWAGDLIMRERTPVLNGSLPGWLQAMNTLRNLQADTIIPGHGPITNSMNVALVAQYDYLTQLLQETRGMIQAGLSINEATERTQIENTAGWLFFPEHHKANLNRAYIELEWE